MSVRCLVADDHPPVVDAVSRYLRGNGIDVVGTASNGVEAVEKIERMRPQIALVDVRMPGVAGVEVVRQVAARVPETAVIVYTGFADQALLQEALDGGARGLVLKEAPLADLIRAIETVARGDAYVDPVLGGMGATRNGTPELTARERDVLRLLAEGYSNEEIGKALFIAPDTVRTHVKKSCRKLGARTRTQAVATALRLSQIA